MITLQSRQTFLNVYMFYYWYHPRAGAPFRALARGEGTNSARLFTPGEREALAKSKVHQWSRAWVTNRSIFKSTHLENHVSHNKLWSNFCLKKWEELKYSGKWWNIGQVCFECLMFMNYVASIYCVKHALLSFSMKLY